MANIYDIDYSLQGPELLSPDKRDGGTIALVTAFLKSVQWSRDLLLTSYKTGATAANYAAGTYAKDAMVVYNKSVYLSLASGNIAAPTDTTKWQIIQDNFLGTDQRVKFNGQKIVLEYALNQQFGGTFRPPGSSSLSDIYLTNLPSVISGFNVGQTEPFTQSVGQTTSSKTIGLPYPFVQINNFQVNFLTALFASTTDKAVRNFANKYVPISLNYIIVLY